MKAGIAALVCLMLAVLTTLRVVPALAEEKWADVIAEDGLSSGQILKEVEVDAPPRKIDLFMKKGLEGARKINKPFLGPYGFIAESFSVNLSRSPSVRVKLKFKW